MISLRREGKLSELGNIVGLLGSTKGLLQISDPEFKIRHNPLMYFSPAIFSSASVNLLIGRELDLTRVGVLPGKYDKVKGDQGV